MRCIGRLLMLIGGAAMRLRVALALVIVLTSLGAAGPAAADGRDVVAAEPSPMDGLPIVRIVFIRENIFDTSRQATSYWPYRAANALHVVTRERFLRSMLLFSEGEPYSQAKAAESARMLRSLDFLNPVNITPRRVEGGVEVTVQTHDQWTLEVGAKLGLFGDRSSHSFAFIEENFLGWGREVSIEYESDNERDSWTYSFFDPNLLGSRWRARLLHEDSSDGSRELIRVEYPFYSLATSRSWGVLWQDEELEEHLYSESETVVLGRSRSEDLRIWAAMRLPGDGDLVRRLGLAWVNRRERFDDWRLIVSKSPVPTPEDRRVQGPRVSFQQVADRYVVLEGFRAWSAQEDVGLGPDIDVGMTISLPAFGGDMRRVLLDGSLSTATRRDGWLFLADGWASGRFDEDDLQNLRAGVQLAAAQLGPTGWQARIMVESTWEPDREVQLTLGADTGLRGWDPDYFDGTGRAVANLQWRSLLREDVLDLFSLGVVFFTDAGMTWGARVGPGTGRVHADAGVGLLADLKQISLARLLRVDVAMPDDGTGPVVTVTASALF